MTYTGSRSTSPTVAPLRWQLLLILVVIPTSAEAPLRVVMDGPDYRILITLMGIGVVWGIIRTVLTGFWLIRSRSKSDVESAPAR